MKRQNTSANFSIRRTTWVKCEFKNKSGALIFAISRALGIFLNKLIVSIFLGRCRASLNILQGKIFFVKIGSQNRAATGYFPYIALLSIFVFDLIYVNYVVHFSPSLYLVPETDSLCITSYLHLDSFKFSLWLLLFLGPIL